MSWITKSEKKNELFDVTENDNRYLLWKLNYNIYITGIVLVRTCKVLEYHLLWYFKGYSTLVFYYLAYEYIFDFTSLTPLYIMYILIMILVVVYIPVYMSAGISHPCRHVSKVVNRLSLRLFI